MKAAGAIAAAVVAVAAAASAAERPYEFRRRLDVVHLPGRRDASLLPRPGELSLDGAVAVAVGQRPSEFLFRVAEDFADYLGVSMSVTARVVRAESGGVAVRVDPELPPRQYVVDVTPAGVVARGSDERAAAQALYHLEDCMNLRRAPFLALGERVRRPCFETRMTFSGYGYLSLPDSHLNAMAHAGMTAVVLPLCGEKGQGENGSPAALREIMRRAGRYGLDGYVCFYEPRPVHPDDGEKAFDEAFGSVAAAIPEARALIFVGESCRFPSKDPRVRPYGSKDTSLPSAAGFPCSDYPDWIRCVQRAVSRRAPGMKAILWTYNWGGRPEDIRLDMVGKMTPETPLMVTFEMFERHRLSNGIETPTADYSISFPGPGRYFTSEAAAARRLGLTLFSQANTGGRTWDFGTAPYEPFPYQWVKRWSAVVQAHYDYGLSGVMENWEYGWTPSFIAELEKEAFTEGGLGFDEHLRLIAVRDFGGESAESAIRAWRLWSEAIADYAATDANQYGPFRCGPAYPFSAGRGKVTGDDFPVTPNSFVGTDFIRMNYLGYGFKRSTEDLSVPYMKKEVELLAGMSDRLERGAGLFQSIPGDAARRQCLLGRYMAATCRTARNVKRGWIAAAEGDEAGLMRAARDEYANAGAAIALVEADSHLGYEPIMDYVGGPDQIRWKLRLMERLYGKDALK